MRGQPHYLHLILVVMLIFVALQQKSKNTTNHQAPDRSSETTENEEQQINQKVETDYTEQAHAGDVEAQFKQGEMYYLGKGIRKNKTLALFWIKKAAQQNYRPAVLAMAHMYANRELGDDYAQDFYWHFKASNLGDTQSYNILADRYTYGIGTVSDREKAAYWYQKGAEAGDVTAQHNMGWVYHYGFGVEKDRVKAKFWYEQAIKAGHRESKIALQKLQTE